MSNPNTTKDTAQYDYSSASPHTKGGHVNLKYLRSRIDPIDSKYQTPSLTENQHNLQRHPKASHKVTSAAAESNESKNVNLENINPVFADIRQLPAELESVQERSIEQSVITHKGSTFNESARLREEMLKYRSDDYADRDINTVLNFSSESIYPRSKQRRQNHPSEPGVNILDQSNREDSFVNIRSPQEKLMKHQSERNRTLSESIRKYEPLRSPEEPRRNFERNKSSGGFAASSENNRRAYPRELNKTMGGIENYSKDKYGGSEDREEKPETDAKAKKSRGPSLHADKSVVQRPVDIEEAIQQIERLESKLRAKDKLIDVMKARHDEIWQKFQSAQQELYKIKSEQEYMQNQYQLNTLHQKIQRLEVAEATLSRENEELQQIEKDRVRRIHDLNAQVQNLQIENVALAKRYQAKIETLINKINQIEYSTQSIRDPFGEVSALKKIIEDSSIQVRSLENQVEEVQRKNEILSRIIRDQDKKLQRAEQIAEEDFRSIIDDRVNQTLHETSRNYSYKIKKYKQTIEQLEKENENLKLELKARPTLRQQREVESRLKNLEIGAQEDKGLARETLRSPESAAPYKKLVTELKAELGIESSGELIPKVRDLLVNQKASAKFNTAITDMVVKCAPPSYFAGKPTLRESWKFIKTIMEEYISLKKQKGNENQDKEREMTQIIDNVAAYVGAQSKEEIAGKVKDMVADYNLMDMVVLKFKALMQLENVPSLEELDKALSHLLRRDKEPSNT